MCNANENVLKTIVFVGFLQLSGAAFLRCYNGSLEDYRVSPLDTPLSIWPCGDTAIPTVIYTFGYRGRPTGPATTAVLTAYIARKKKNVILLDWEQEARSDLLGIPLGYVLRAVPNAKKIGVEMGEALIQLQRAGLNMTDIHLVGHSLGAHIMAFAGKHAREKGHVVSRITGLDPARALFEGIFAIKSGLDRTCARFVDIVHSDPGGYGTSNPTGSVDFWPNQSGKGGAQPGCPVGEFEMFSPDDLCNHDRAWRYFVEAIMSPTSFPAVSANSYDDWLASNGQTNQTTQTNQTNQTTQTTYLGELTSTRANGNYYLMTNSKPQFGMGMEGIKPVDYQARTRRKSTLSTLLKFLK